MYKRTSGPSLNYRTVEEPEVSPRTPNRGQILPSPKTKLMDILSRRDHSETEVRLKMIAQDLVQKGLIAITHNAQEELEKAIELVENKFFLRIKEGLPERGKVGRFLMSRGFSSDTIRKVIYGTHFKF